LDSYVYVWFDRPPIECNSKSVYNPLNQLSIWGRAFMAQLLYYILKTARPRQWIKNLAVFAALVFSGLLFHPGYFERVLMAYVLFCGLASAVYLVNDIADAPQDRKHPFKKKRPIASGIYLYRLRYLLRLL
jgi:hypothetical protein